MRPSVGPASSTALVNTSKSSMPACRVRVMPVSGAQHDWKHEMLQAAVHSMYMRPGSGPTFTSRCGMASSGASGSLSGQSPQNDEPPLFRSSRSWLAVGPVQISATVAVRTSPSTRLAYGSAQPQTMRPSQSITAMECGQEQVKRVAR